MDSNTMATKFSEIERQIRIRGITDLREAMFEMQKILAEIAGMEHKPFDFVPTSRPTVVNVMNVTDRKYAEPIRRVLEGQTYMDFRVTVCPVGGSFNVNVETDYKADESEIRAFIMGLLACEVK